MTIAETLSRVRSAFGDTPTLAEIKMFGGVCFTVNGNMTVGVSEKRGMLVRVGPDHHDRALEETATRPMIMRGKPMSGYIYVDPVPADARTLKKWIGRALEHNRSLAPKKKGRPAKRATKRT